MTPMFPESEQAKRNLTGMLVLYSWKEIPCVTRNPAGMSPLSSPSSPIGQHGPHPAQTQTDNPHNRYQLRQFTERLY